MGEDEPEGRSFECEAPGKWSARQARRPPERTPGPQREWAEKRVSGLKWGGCGSFPLQDIRGNSCLKHALPEGSTELLLGERGVSIGHQTHQGSCEEGRRCTCGGLRPGMCGSWWFWWPVSVP